VIHEHNSFYRCQCSRFQRRSRRTVFVAGRSRLWDVLYVLLWHDVLLFGRRLSELLRRLHDKLLPIMSDEIG
jgi:hypothetical protein